MDPNLSTAAETEAIEGLDPEIEAQMAADEAEWSRQAAGSGRDDRGRFTSAETAPRASQAEAEPKLEEGGDPATAKQSDEQQQQQQATPQATPAEAAKTAEQRGKGEEGKAEAKPETPNSKLETKTGSAWARENERKAKTWEGINQTKAELAAEREQLKLERDALTAQAAQAATAARDANGYTAADYERVGKRSEAQAQRLTQQALEAETGGRFEEADRLNAKAGEEIALAKAAGERAQSLRGAGPGSVWDRLKTDLPEALQFNGPVNIELRKLLRGNPQLLADPMGPYRAAVQVGRSVLQATEQKLAAAQAEAGKVPQLQKQIEELSARVRELQAATSLPRGGAAISRGGSEGQSFGDLTLEQMEAQLAAEAAA